MKLTKEQLMFPILDIKVGDMEFSIYDDGDIEFPAWAFRFLSVEVLEEVVETAKAFIDGRNKQ